MDLRVEVQATSPRRLWALVRSLPADAAIRREGKAWSQSDELQAVAIERNDHWMRWLAIGQNRKPKDVPPLPPIKHPDRQCGEPGRSRRQVNPNARRLSVAEFQEMYASERG